jgi:hypothetical protein
MSTSFRNTSRAACPAADVPDAPLSAALLRAVKGGGKVAPPSESARKEGKPFEVHFYLPENGRDAGEAEPVAVEENGPVLRLA